MKLNEKNEFISIKKYNIKYAYCKKYGAHKWW